tara:strand:- start:405 stop:593 length:189 start_codon:yes stop_codon:yes gene_type:complete
MEMCFAPPPVESTVVTVEDVHVVLLHAATFRTSFTLSLNAITGFPSLPTAMETNDQLVLFSE